MYAYDQGQGQPPTQATTRDLLAFARATAELGDRAYRTQAKPRRSAALMPLVAPLGLLALSIALLCLRLLG